MNLPTARAFAAALSLMLPSCVIVADDDDPPPTGLLTIEWSIDQGIATRDCRLVGADRLRLEVLDDRRRLEVDTYPICERFETTVLLPTGRYFPEITLVDDLEFPVSDTLVLDSVRVREDEELIVTVDFDPEVLL